MHTVAHQISECREILGLCDREAVGLGRREAGRMPDAAVDVGDQQVGEHVVPVLADALEAVAGDGVALGQRPADDVHVAGTHNICVQPEFRDALDVASVLELVEHKDVLAQVLTGRQGVVVTIGDENDRRELRLCSLVTASYDIAGSQGVIGVVGPTRMPYDRVVALVDYAASRAAQLGA